MSTDTSLDLFQELVWGPLVKAALAKLFVLVPWLGWGPVGWVVSYAITKFAAAFYDEAQKHINLKAVAFVNQQHRKAFDEAAVALRIVGLQKGMDSEAFQKARETHREKLSDFVRFSPAR